MGQLSLIRVMAVGAVITLAGGSGIYALFSDRAMTGSNSVTTGDVPTPPPGDTHLQIANTSSGDYPLGCGTFSDDLATGLFTIADLTASSYPYSLICLKNAGTTTMATVSMTVEDLVETETGCSTGEVAAGDATCGNDLEGELSSGLVAFLNRPACSTGSTSGPAGYLDLATLQWSAIILPGSALAPGDIACVYVGVTWTGDATTLQLTQTDQLTWRFAFDGVTE
jgi:predicted ribosomally synthesized peptide with SipW-like signal peptide